jgi:chromosomal replication initiation ATPase DnaA
MEPLLNQQTLAPMNNSIPQIPLPDLLEIVSKQFRVSTRDVLSRSHKAEVVQPRHAFCNIAHTMGHPKSTIGRFIGRDYSTVFYSCKIVEDTPIKGWPRIKEQIVEKIKNLA